LKVEFYDRCLWPTRAAAKLCVGDWIERVYNRRRRGTPDLAGQVAPIGEPCQLRGGDQIGVQVFIDGPADHPP
jgi:hypothetical protein